MAIINSTFFYGSITIPGINNSSSTVTNDLNWFIDEHEPKLLELLLGYELKKAYDLGIVGDIQIYKDIRDGKEYQSKELGLTKWKGLSYTVGGSKKSLVANYIYFYFMQNRVTSSSQSGEKKNDKENSKEWTPDFKTASSWNWMVDEVYNLRDFLIENKVSYPEYKDPLERTCKDKKRQELFLRENPLW